MSLTRELNFDVSFLLKKGVVSVLSVYVLLTRHYRGRTLSGDDFIEVHSYEKGFRDHYKQHLWPLVEDFEIVRLASLDKASRNARICAPLLIIITILSLYWGVMTENTNEGTIKTALVVLFITYSAAAAWIYRSINDYTACVKNRIFPDILSFLGDYKYSATCPDSVYKYLNSEIIPAYDRESSEDSISGIYNGVTIDLFETHLEEEHRSEDGTSYVSVFKGIVINLSMHKKFRGKTIIKKDAGRVGNWFKDKLSHLESVKLEDPRFEKLFEVYSSDQIEARYLLTTSFMERLLQLSESFGGKGLECSFYDNKLLLMIPVQQDMFEPGSIFNPEDFIDDAKSLLKEMHMIFSIIDILKLDQDIGM